MAFLRSRENKPERRNPWSRGIYYGYTEDGKEQLYTGDRHIFSTGANGSGKTKRWLVRALAHIAGHWSALIADVNGELAPMLGPHFEAMGSEVVYLEPFGKNSRGFNPIASIPIDENLPDNTLSIAESVITLKDTKEQHFPQGYQDVAAGLMMFARLMIGKQFRKDAAGAFVLDADGNCITEDIPGAEPGSMEDVRNLTAYPTEKFQGILNNPEFEYKGVKYPGILRCASRIGWPEMANKLNRFSDFKPDNRELLSIISTGLIQTRSFDSRPIKRDLKGPPYDFRQMKKRPIVVFLALPPKHLGKHATWFRLNTAAVIQALMEEIATPDDVPCLIALDEFFAIADGGFDAITKNMAMFRKYGIKLWTIWQDLSQAAILLGERGFETFIANAGIFNNFAPQDQFTCDYLSRMTGTYTEMSGSHTEATSRTTGAPANRSRSGSYSQVQIPQMWPQDIRNMKEGETLVFSHTFQGGRLRQCPYPTELPGLSEIMRRDPST